MLLQNWQKKWTHGEQVDQSDISELLGNDCETTGQGHQKKGQGEGRTSIHRYGIFSNLFNLLNTQYQPCKVLGSGRRRKDIKIKHDLNPKGIGYIT